MSRSGVVERAIAALRTGRAVRIESAEPFAFVSIETATPELLQLLDPNAKAPLLLSGRRAAALSLANERDAADPAQPVLVAREPWLDPAAAITPAERADQKSNMVLPVVRPAEGENLRIGHVVQRQPRAGQQGHLRPQVVAGHFIERDRD